MNKKIIAFSFIAWAIAAISSASPAQANAIIPGLKVNEVVTQVVVTNRTRPPESTCLEFNDGGSIQYEQFMVLFILDTGSGTERVAADWVGVNFIYGLGPKAVTFHAVETCENVDYQIYGLDTCDC